jgi:hypothetical protein
LGQGFRKGEEYSAREWKSSPAMSENLFLDGAFKLADALGVEIFPMTLIVDQSGKILKI